MMLARQANRACGKAAQPAGPSLRPRKCQRSSTARNVSIEDVDPSLRGVGAAADGGAVASVPDVNHVLDLAATASIDNTAALGATVIFGLGMMAAYAAYTVQDKSMGRFEECPQGDAIAAATASTAAPATPATAPTPPPPANATPAQAAASAAAGVKSVPLKDVAADSDATPEAVAARKADARNWIQQFMDRAPAAQAPPAPTPTPAPAAASGAAAKQAADAAKAATAGAPAAAAAAGDEAAAAADKVKAEMEGAEEAMKAQGGGSADNKGPLAALLAWLKSVWQAIKAMLGGGSSTSSGTPKAA